MAPEANFSDRHMYQCDCYCIITGIYVKDLLNSGKDKCPHCKKLDLVSMRDIGSMG